MMSAPTPVIGYAAGTLDFREKNDGTRPYSWNLEGARSSVSCDGNGWSLGPRDVNVAPKDEKAVGAVRRPKAQA